jgi:hypothetical protein
VPGVYGICRCSLLFLGAWLPGSGCMHAHTLLMCKRLLCVVSMRWVRCACTLLGARHTCAGRSEGVSSQMPPCSGLQGSLSAMLGRCITVCWTLHVLLRSVCSWYACEWHDVYYSASARSLCCYRWLDVELMGFTHTTASCHCGGGAGSCCGAVSPATVLASGRMQLAA